jgi:hypothetical protein
MTVNHPSLVRLQDTEPFMIIQNHYGDYCLVNYQTGERVKYSWDRNELLEFKDKSIGRT